MTNEEKYKSTEDRIEAFREYCADHECVCCEINVSREVPPGCALRWLALEAEAEKPEQCPFCGGETHTNLGHLTAGVVHYWVECISPDCMYRSKHYTVRDAAIAAHNRVARAVRAAKESDAEKDER